MRAIFNQATGWERHEKKSYLDGATERQAREVLVVLNIEQIKALLVQVKEPRKTAVLLAIVTGLCVSELLAINWSDVDFKNLLLNVTRSIADQHVGPCKTEASRKPVPLDPELAEVLLMRRRQTPYPGDGDWLFASPAKGGKLPYWSFSLFRVYVKLALKAASILGKAGWRTFLRDDPEVVWKGCEDGSRTHASREQ